MVQQVKPESGRKYQVLTSEIRQEVIKRLIFQQQTIKKVCEDLSLKYCTCRNILQDYKQKGKIGKCQKRKSAILHQTKIQLSIINPITNTSSEYKTFHSLEEKILVDKTILEPSDRLELVKTRKVQLLNEITNLFKGSLMINQLKYMQLMNRMRLSLLNQGGFAANALEVKERFLHHGTQKVVETNRLITLKIEPDHSSTSLRDQGQIETPEQYKKKGFVYQNLPSIDLKST